MYSRIPILSFEHIKSCSFEDIRSRTLPPHNFFENTEYVLHVLHTTEQNDVVRDIWTGACTRRNESRHTYMYRTYVHTAHLGARGKRKPPRATRVTFAFERWLIHVYIYIYIYIYVIYIFEYMYMYIYIYVCIHLYTQHASTHKHTDMCRTHKQIPTYASAHTCMDLYTYAKQLCTHMRTQIFCARPACFVKHRLMAVCVSAC